MGEITFEPLDGVPQGITLEPLEQNAEEQRQRQLATSLPLGVPKPGTPGSVGLATPATEYATRTQVANQAPTNVFAANAQEAGNAFKSGVGSAMNLVFPGYVDTTQAPLNPVNEGARTSVGRGVGSLAAMFAAGPEAVPYMLAAQGLGSAAEEGQKSGWSESQAATVGLERVAMNLLLFRVLKGISPIRPTVGGGAATQTLKTAAELYGLNVGQPVLENKLKQTMGIESPGEWETLKQHALSGDTLANTALFTAAGLLVHDAKVNTDRVQEEPGSKDARAVEQVKAQEEAAKTKAIAEGDTSIYQLQHSRFAPLASEVPADIQQRFFQGDLAQRETILDSLESKKVPSGMVPSRRVSAQEPTPTPEVNTSSRFTGLPPLAEETVPYNSMSREMKATIAADALKNYRDAQVVRGTSTESTQPVIGISQSTGLIEQKLAELQAGQSAVVPAPESPPPQVSRPEVPVEQRIAEAQPTPPQAESTLVAKVPLAETTSEPTSKEQVDALMSAAHQVSLMNEGIDSLETRIKKGGENPVDTQQLQEMKTNKLRLESDIEEALHGNGTSEDAYARLQRLRQRAGGFVDFTGVVDGALKAGRWAESHVALAADWVKSHASDALDNIHDFGTALVKRFGNAIKPHIENVWNFVKSIDWSEPGSGPERDRTVAEAQMGMKNEGAVGDLAAVRAKYAQQLGQVAPTPNLEDAQQKLSQKLPETNDLADKFATAATKQVKESPSQFHVPFTTALQSQPEKSLPRKLITSTDAPATRLAFTTGFDKAPEVKRVLVDNLRDTSDAVVRQRNQNTAFVESSDKTSGINQKQMQQTPTKFVTSDGRTVELTPAERGHIWASYDAQYNREQMGKTDEMNKQDVPRGMAVTRQKQVQKLSPEDVQKIHDTATPQEKALGQGLFTLAEKQLPGVQNTYRNSTGKEMPLRADGKYLPVEYYRGGQQQDTTPGVEQWNQAQLEKMGLVQPTVGGDAPLLVRDAFDVRKEMIRDASIYTHKTEAIRDAKMLLGNPKMREALIRTQGASAVKYWDNVVNDSSMMAPSTVAPEIARYANKLRSNVSIGKIAGRPSTVLKHVSNVINLATEFTNGHMGDYTAGLADAIIPSKRAQATSEIEKYGGVLANRIDPRRYDPETPTVGPVGQVMGKFKGALMSPLTAVDKTSVVGAWEANKRIISREQPQLKGDAYFQEVNRRTLGNVESTMNPMMKESQSGIARAVNKVPVANWSLMFSGPENQSWNLIRREYARGMGGDWKRAGTNLALLGASRLAVMGAGAAFSGAAIKYGVQRVRGVTTEQDKQDLLKTSVMNMVKELGGPMYGGKEVLSGITQIMEHLNKPSSSISSPPESTLGDIQTSLSALGSLLSQSEATSPAEDKLNARRVKALRALTTALLDVTGVPGSAPLQVGNQFYSAATEPENFSQTLLPKLRDDSTREQTIDRMRELVQQKLLTRDKFHEILQESRHSDAYNAIEGADVNKAIKLWRDAGDEQSALTPLVRRKVRNSALNRDEKLRLLTTLEKE